MANLLALDQSSRISGYAIFQEGKLIKWGKIVVEDNDIGLRLVKIRKEVENLITTYNINEVIIEDIQLQGNVTNNVQTFKTLAEVFGVIYELVTELNIKNSAVLASYWKSTLWIKGKTRPEQKRNAQEFIQKTYNIKPTQDECDAICIGCHHLIHKVSNDSFDWSD